ncbi:Dual specificity protein phosphatase [Hondaea fermentalgiana]|uniref:Dual specificity protein phosphatase n=1 Tax=Hondaea fermentalgiana TaxID=2315210 RepID=A0A2R5GM72_9STRA|nr:Dual specificity protein phosphatase [Hondaea fermentalgiana]|eukprot:GBG31980.1 Dual specificity protein phosphatase [Hondaea fermentalgiana]
MGNKSSQKGSVVRKSDREEVCVGAVPSTPRRTSQYKMGFGSSSSKTGGARSSDRKSNALRGPALPARASKTKSSRHSEDAKRSRAAKAAQHADALAQKQKQKNSRRKAQEDVEHDDSDDGVRRPPPMISPGALAMQAALKKNAASSGSGPTSGAPGAGSGRPPHPLAAAFAGAAGGGGGGGMPLRPVFNPGDFAKATLKKSSGPTTSTTVIAASAPQETGMDTVRQKAIEDARKCSKEASVIYPWLSVSGDWVARNKEVLHEAGVTHILNMAHTVCKNYHQDTGEFDYLALEVIDSANESILPFLLEAIMYIEKARTSSGSCFVHCHMGVSRSCTVVIAYMMWKDGATFEEAFDVVKAKRPVCNPNAGFVAQLMEFQRYLRQEPRKPELYRIAPHSNKDPSLVLKLCYDTRETTRPVTARPTELDARGVFVLHEYRTSTCFIWSGPRCEHEADFVSAAEKWIGWSVDLLPFFKNHHIAYCQDQDPEIHKNFWVALGVDAADAEEMDDTDVDQDLGKYDEEYGGRTSSPKHVSKISHRSIVSSADKIRRAAERYVVELYGWYENEHHEDHWARLENYDSDDLASEAMFVLLVKDRDDAPPPSANAPLVFERAYIWLGSRLEDRINEDASVAKARAFVQSRKTASHASTVEIVIEHEDAESDDFWGSYEAGY